MGLRTRIKTGFKLITRRKDVENTIKEYLKAQLPEAPSKKQITWCYWDYFWFWLKYDGSIDIDYFGTQIFRKSEFVRRDSFANQSRFKWRNRIQDKKWVKVLEDKRRLYQAFSKYMERNYMIIDKNCSLEEYEKFIASLKGEVVSKESFNWGGKGTRFWNIETEKEELYQYCISRNDVVIEEKIKQCKDMSAFNPDSVNTIRMITIIDKSGNANIANAVLRIGRKNSGVDNYSSGGMAAPIDVHTGIIYMPARDQWGREYIIHPDTGKQIVGHKIEDWEKYKEFAKELALEVPTVRYVGWDIVRTDRNTFCMIEGNAGAGMDVLENGLMYGLKPYFNRLLEKKDGDHI